ncbi:MAG TPA: zinc metalloprotease HtpX [Afifellaceae bacterium]|nr:zinc metalloprotease HtpX [Afifellaceae bacterium]
MTTRIDPAIHRRARWRNIVNTWLIIAGLVALLALTAWLLLGTGGVVWTAILGFGFLVFGPQISPAMILRLYKARQLGPHHVPALWEVLEKLAARADLPAVPQLHYVPSANMNAFAVGRREDAAIAITDGLLRGLNLRQLTGVLAHEISHIANGDIRVMALADIVNRLTGALQTMGLLLLFFGLWQGGNAILAAPVLILAPTFGALLQLALSRSREYDADLEAAQLTGDPEGLASALATLERRQGHMWESFVLPGSRIPDPSILRTHPPAEERIRRLLALGGREYEPMEQRERPLVLPGGYPRIVRRPRFHPHGLWY